MRAIDILSVLHFLELDLQSEAQLVFHFHQLGIRLQLSLHHLSLDYSNEVPSNRNADNFIEYCSKTMINLNYEKAAKDAEQRKSYLWYELKYARVTASNIYEAA